MRPEQMTQIVGGHPYQLEKLLAEGSDTLTWSGRDADSGAEVIVKILQLGLLADWKQLELFQREARILKHLRHPRIPALLDDFSSETPGGLSYCLVTPRVQGQTLAQRLKGQWLPSEADCIELAGQILEILVYLHGFNPPVVHRDLKPSNLLLDDAGRIHLIDFGAVQELLCVEGSEGSTTVGTMGYMAPEQFRGKAEPASDLYALGATVVHLLSGRNPDDLPRRGGRIQYRGFTNCSLPFLEWLDFLLFPELKDRFSSAEAALDQLDRLSGRSSQGKRELLRPEAMPIVTAPKPAKPVEPVRGQPAGSLLGGCLEGRYRIASVLGQGSRATVYLGESLADGQSVVVKELSLKQMSHWKELELFQREAETLRELDHPCIPRFLDCFEIQDELSYKLYLVAAEIPGQTLLQRLVDGWRPGALEVWSLVRQLLEILVYLQNRPQAVLHRDIKPSNLLLDSSGRLCLIDFGAVQNRFRPTGGGGSTVIGTVGYMAPEQFRGKASLNTDLYGVGATVIHLLSGRNPAELPISEADGLRIDFEPYLHCPTAMLQWLARMVDPDPAARYASAEEALQALRRHLASPEAPPESKPLRGRSREMLPKVLPGTPVLAICQQLLGQSPLLPDPDQAVIKIPVSRKLASQGRDLALVRESLLFGSFTAAALWAGRIIPALDLVNFIIASLLIAMGLFALALARAAWIPWLDRKLLPQTLAAGNLELELGANLLVLRQYCANSKPRPPAVEPVANPIDNPPPDLEPYFSGHINSGWEQYCVRGKRVYQQKSFDWSQIQVLTLEPASSAFHLLEPIYRLSIQQPDSGIEISFALAPELAPRLEACLREVQKTLRTRQHPAPVKRPFQSLKIGFPLLPAAALTTMIYLVQGISLLQAGSGPAKNEETLRRQQANQAAEEMAERNLPPNDMARTESTSPQPTSWQNKEQTGTQAEIEQPWQSQTQPASLPPYHPAPVQPAYRSPAYPNSTNTSTSRYPAATQPLYPNNYNRIPNQPNQNPNPGTGSFGNPGYTPPNTTTNTYRAPTYTNPTYTNPTYTNPGNYSGNVSRYQPPTTSWNSGH
ncbi:MAG TPA: protein kinase [Candidatus Obscuribacterales bacterium]